MLKYPDGKYLMMVRSATGWFIGDKSNGDWITEQHVQEIGKMIEENEKIIQSLKIAVTIDLCPNGRSPCRPPATLIPSGKSL